MVIILMGVRGLLITTLPDAWKMALLIWIAALWVEQRLVLMATL
jgi:hypothetical protein